MSEEYDQIQRAVEANRAMPFPQYPLTVATPNDIGEPQQPQFLPERGGGISLASNVAVHPFPVTIRVEPGSDPVAYRFIVGLRSNVLTNIYPMETATIVGLAALDTPSPSDPAWKTLGTPTDTIYIEWKASDGSYTIKSIGAGGDWDLVNAVDFTGLDQTFSRAIIATTVDNGGVPRLIQKVNTDLIFAQYAVEGRVPKVFMPHTGAR